VFIGVHLWLQFPVSAASDPIAPAARVKGVDSADLSYTYGVGSFTPEYTPPAPGSYTLPIIKSVTGQPVAKLRFADGQWSGLFRHVLKVSARPRQSRAQHLQRRLSQPAARVERPAHGADAEGNHR
jgi:hypothetical protein